MSNKKTYLVVGVFVVIMTALVWTLLETYFDQFEAKPTTTVTATPCAYGQPYGESGPVEFNSSYVDCITTATPLYEATGLLEPQPSPLGEAVTPTPEVMVASSLVWCPNGNIFWINEKHRVGADSTTGNINFQRVDNYSLIMTMTADEPSVLAFVNDISSNISCSSNGFVFATSQGINHINSVTDERILIPFEHHVPSLDVSRDGIVALRTTDPDALWTVNLESGEEMRLTDDAVRSIEDVGWHPYGSYFLFVRYSSSGSHIESHVNIAYSNSAEFVFEQLINVGQAYSGLPSWSHDGVFIASSIGREIVIVDSAGNLIKRIPADYASMADLSWSSVSNDRLAFVGRELSNGVTGDRNLWLLNTAEETFTSLAGPWITELAWSPSGDQIAYIQNSETGSLIQFVNVPE